MKTPFWQRIDITARNQTPVASTILLGLLTVVPLPLPGYGRIAPALVIPAVYHWSIYRPDLMSGMAAFTIGVLMDFLGGTVPGVTALTLVLVRAAVLSQRRVFLSMSFFVDWGVFGVICGAALALRWLLLSVLHGTLLPPLPVLIQGLVTLACYPVITWTFARTQNRLMP